mgnify:CR=1 FL=1
MRSRITAFLLISACVTWGIWCGGQVFNELMTIPIFSYDPPASMKIYSELPRKGGFVFFIVFNPLFEILTIAATLFAWRSARRSRKWLLATTFIGLAVVLSLILYLAPLIQESFQHSIAGDMPADQIAANVEFWKLGNRIRLVVESIGFICSLIALHTWARDVHEIREPQD